MKFIFRCHLSQWTHPLKLTICGYTSYWIITETNGKIIWGFHNHLDGGLVHITVKTWYYLQYLTICLSGYVQQSLPSLLSDMAWNISCNTHMNLSCIQERKISKQVRSHINYFSKQVMHKSTKIRKNPTSSTHIVMQIMQEIFLTGALSPQQLTSSVEPPMTVAPRKIWDI